MECTYSTSIIDLLHQGNQTTQVLAQIIQKGLESGQLNLQDDTTISLVQTIAQNPLQLYSCLSQQIPVLPTDSGEQGQSSNLIRRAAASSVHRTSAKGVETREVCHTSSRQHLLGNAEGNNVSGRSDSTCEMLLNGSCTSTASLSTITLSLEDKECLEENDCPISNKRSICEPDDVSNSDEDRSKRIRELNGPVYTTVDDIQMYLAQRTSKDNQPQLPHHETILLLVQYVISCCQSTFRLYNQHSLIILDLDIEIMSNKNDTIGDITIIERPNEFVQMYVASGLSTKSHFSCPTTLVPYFVSEIQRIQNVTTPCLLFIPNTCHEFKTETLHVLNMVTNMHNTDVDEILMEIRELSGDKSDTGSLMSSGNKRSHHSLSIGLQLQYSYQHHRARYCMLRYSRPHLVTIREYSVLLRSIVLSMYASAIGRLDMTRAQSDVNSNGYCDIQDNPRYELRREVLNFLSRGIANTQPINTGIPLEQMFESCTVQPTSALALHCDKMNCPHDDKTFAVLVPASSKVQCVSFLYYSRKIVTDYTKRMDLLKSTVSDKNQCPLMRLCLRFILGTGTIFDYQSTLFERELSLDDIGQQLEEHPDHSVPSLLPFCGMKGFRHGAAFDKMGYYSVFVSCFLSMHYMHVMKNMSDAISMCMYFGLLCNGTSSLVAVWSEVVKRKKEAQSYLKEREVRPTRLFSLLVRFDCAMRDCADSVVPVGSCKLYRFQYPNNSCSIMGKKNLIMSTVQSFIQKYQRNLSSSSRASDMHNMLYKELRDRKIKGIGPMVFNQFWHCLCLCGILPISFIHSCGVSSTAGPAKLIRCFYPQDKKETCLEKRLCSIQRNLSSIGVNKATQFFIENMLCEIWRLASTDKHNILKDKNVNLADKEKYLFSEKFHSMFMSSGVSPRPDIYYRDPNRPKHYQHLFSLNNNELLMRPSTVKISGTSSPTVTCCISYKSKGGGECLMEWRFDPYTQTGTNSMVLRGRKVEIVKLI